MLGSRQPSALGRGGRAAPMPDVSRGTPARRRGQAAPFTKQARDRTRHLLALALQPGRLLHASRTAPRERGQLTLGRASAAAGSRLARRARYPASSTHQWGERVSRGPGAGQTDSSCVFWVPCSTIVPPSRATQRKVLFSRSSNTIHVPWGGAVLTVGAGWPAARLPAARRAPGVRCRSLAAGGRAGLGAGAGT